jgi:membrane-bound serine protease (ClpP class)
VNASYIFYASQLLSVMTHPAIAYGLLLIGIYGLLFEGYNPGAVFPGVAGAISLLIALFAFRILSVSYAGLALVAVGVGIAIVIMAWLASRSSSRPVVTGVQTMVGQSAEALEAFVDKGRVRYGGEIWNARSSSGVGVGQIVRITRVEGLTLWVEPV